MRMMGTDSVEYHRQTVLARGDDHPGAALGYYASRGETPLVWGGAGAGTLGLAGAVTDEAYSALFGPGGASDPRSGERLGATRRPGMELVVATHKSVAELGVIGKAEDMHAIMDAERDATLGYLDEVTQARGGRRGRGAATAPTGGLIYATTRHATSRAGDPAPHDHVLLANVVQMTDAKGGWKAADTTAWRTHLHAATVIGRLASARVAVERGYAIEPDAGPSGRLGHWRITGIPDEVCQYHSKRSAQIEEELERTGHSSYRARGIAARASRGHKRHEPIADLMGHWRSELAEAGWPLQVLQENLARANAVAALPEPVDYLQELALAQEVLGPDGALAQAKVFSRRELIVATGPHLYGQTMAEATRVIDRMLGDAEVMPLMARSGAKERVYALASVIAAETGIAAAVELGATATDRTKVPVESAVAEVAARRGYGLSPEQESLVRHIAGDGLGIDAVIGVAGSGKTTALEALGLAWSKAGHRVLGSATSGQAARNLGIEANIDTHTVASLTRSLEAGRIRLGPTDLIVLDEAGMTEDRDLLKLLNAAGAARAHVVMVGDPLQLAAVGPGGAMEAVAARHPGVHTLTENRRQRDEAERAALGELRHGDVEAAVDYYAGTGRIRTEPDRQAAMEAAVDAYLGDVAAGHETLLLAWRRDHVAEMNALARAKLQDTGALSRVEMTAPGGARYALDDRVVFTAPNHDAGVVTSQTATVFLTDDQGSEPALILELEAGRRVRLEGEAIDAAHLAHAYAMTVHRCQGATVDTAHVLADGGGRELGYVAMSRAREQTHLYLAADDQAQAREDLVRDWSASRRVRWAIDTAWPAGATEAGEVPLHLIYPGLERAVVKATGEAIAAVIPAAVSDDQIRQADRRLEDLEAAGPRIGWGQGRWADPALAEAAEVVRIK
ncbi:MAG: MobF family relaxase [Acidimicrobiales bacterium]